jgi:uncharacterized protein
VHVFFCTPPFGIDREGGVFLCKKGGAAMMKKLVIQDSGELLAGRVRSAQTFMQRLRGLMFTKALEPGAGLHLQPCRSIHTFFMRYAIDVIYLNAESRIVALDLEMPPGRLGSLHPGTVSVVELPAGSLRQAQLKVGQTVHFEA